ncbi:putative G-type lectin S-receptor-like serine/threonine-protein [Sesbania bispinosa]|nr:putative G-type lectin S-receptor-like serine/threonine-protein [Sesbania bispinosa]
MDITIARAEQPFATEEKRALQNDRSFFGLAGKQFAIFRLGRRSFRVDPFSPSLRMSGKLTLKWGDSAPYWEQGLKLFHEFGEFEFTCFGGCNQIYSSKKGSGTVTLRWVAVEDQCEVPSSLYI